MEYFFKYMSTATAKKVLSNNKLRWSSPTLFNDPFDIQFDLNIDVDREMLKPKAIQLLWDIIHSDKAIPNGNVISEILESHKDTLRRVPFQEFENKFGDAIDIGLENFSKAIPELHKKIRNMLYTSKILCLSEIDDNILMWSHYAESHKGVVLKFRHIKESKSAWGAARPVLYTKVMPLLLNDKELIDMFGGTFRIDPAGLLNCMVYTKAIDWSYEKEWRIWFGQGWLKDLYMKSCPLIPKN